MRNATKTTMGMGMGMGMGIGMLGAIVLLAAGCSVSTQHTLDSNDLLDLFPGECLVVASANIPGGALTAYSVSDNVGDDMDIAVVDSSVGCDPTAADTAFTSGTGSVSFSGTIPVSSSYDLQIFCANLVADCIPTVNSWTYEN
jgi:hypothetical protein